ncbi:sigma-70 family RNA polymerase sigma factor [Virgibacillus sp. M23]|uniref:sigma-70 family RNA polymerase sigma factor n=1 Tax=Virgibacillus sp. M23 TaxID=3079030 RepID=UPI002A91B0EA|nr:sigma-70 family RNA polymerase sigma factor [Virgibacillus sp. M23]MDY7044861.1 sigma-70 family RNA polymerase sigma factor [Virgibacillus sp. M23]
MDKTELIKRCKSKMNQPIVNNFLKDKKNYAIFQKALNNSQDKDNVKKLDDAFRNYYKSVKVLSYISKLIYFYSIDYDKKISSYKNKEVYAPDTESNSNDQQDGQQLLEVYFSSQKDLTFADFQQHQTFLDQIEDEGLYQSLKSLKEIQLRILELIYVHGLNNKEVASALDKSEQTISYNHKTALKKLKSHIS